MPILEFYRLAGSAKWHVMDSGAVIPERFSDVLVYMDVVSADQDPDAGGRVSLALNLDGEFADELSKLTSSTTPPNLDELLPDPRVP